MKKIEVLAAVFLILGGLNLGIIGVADFNLVATVLGQVEFLIRVFYILVGLAAVYQIFQWRKIQKRRH